MASSESTNRLSNPLYDKLKPVALIVLPALATLMFTVGTLWDFSHTPQVVGTITAIDTFLGLILKISTSQYYKSGANFDGEVIVRPEDGGITASISADRTLEDIVDDPGKHSVEFQVVHEGKTN